MNDALIGWSGFVGSTLLRQHGGFPHRFRSTNIGGIDGGTYDLVVCAGAPAQKWLANKEPHADRARIDDLIGHLGRVRCERFVLISTVDVFGAPQGVDENSPVDESGLEPYGLHRRLLERFVVDTFPRALVVRLPGLVGPGLRKNAIFDLHNGRGVPAIDPRATFQFYPMVNLWSDLRTALATDLALVHLTAEPIGIADLARDVFGVNLEGEPAGRPPAYDLRSVHSERFGGAGPYPYSRRDTLLATRAYAQSEPRTPP